MNHVDVIVPDVPCQKAAQTGGGLCAGPGLSSRLPLRHFWPVRVRRAVPVDETFGAPVCISRFLRYVPE